MDISFLLKSWDYDPDDAVRLVRADDGRQIMQVRLPLGIEQYELDNRPDGVTPFGKPSVLAELQHRLELHLNEQPDDDDFSIDEEMFEQLQAEGQLYYYRYVLLFQIGDYERSARDTAHNLTICSFIEKYGDEFDLNQSMLQYKPYIVRVNALSRAMIVLNQDQRDKAIQIIEKAIETVRELPDLETTVFQFERMRSLGHLKETLEQIRSEENSEVERLEAELQVAVDREDYERAVEIRDEIAVLKATEQIE